MVHMRGTSALDIANARTLKTAVAGILGMRIIDKRGHEAPKCC